MNAHLVPISSFRPNRQSTGQLPDPFAEDLHPGPGGSGSVNRPAQGGECGGDPSHYGCPWTHSPHPAHGFNPICRS